MTLRPDGSAEVKGETGCSGQRAPEYRRSLPVGRHPRTTFEQGWAQSFPGLSVNKVSISDPTGWTRTWRSTTS